MHEMYWTSMNPSNEMSHNDLCIGTCTIVKTKLMSSSKREPSKPWVLSKLR
jgi:hypothetical protein